MVDGEGDVGVGRLPDWLAVVPGLGEAIRSRFSSIRSAMRLRMRARSAGAVRPQASLAACAASSALSMSAASERATSQTTLPVIGEVFSK